MKPLPGKVILTEATPADLPKISTIGKQIWRKHYPGIISEEQIEYMLARRYSPESLKFQIEQQGHRYFLAWFEGNQLPNGFVSFTNVTKRGESYLYVHRLYLLQSCHGMGIGKIMMDKAVEFATSHGHIQIRLNVHRDNPSVHFYLRYGFTVKEEIDVPYGPYVLNDYTMTYSLISNE